MRYVLISLLVVSRSVLACIGPLPKQINLSGTTYSGSPLTIKSDGFWSFEFDGDTFAYNIDKKQWCINKTKCTDETVHMLLNGKKVGRGEMKGSTLFLFSVDAQGQKDLSKPYLKITDSSTTKEIEPGRPERHLSAKWTIEAFDRGAKVGEYSAENSNQTIGKDGTVYSGVRGITIAQPATGPVTDMRGNEIQSSGCGAPTVSSFAKPTYRMSEGGTGGGASR